jgi:hypothetical protein
VLQDVISEMAALTEVQREIICRGGGQAPVAAPERFTR